MRLHREISLFLLLRCVCIISSSSESCSDGATTREGEWEASGLAELHSRSPAQLFFCVVFLICICVRLRHRSWAFRDARYDYFTFSILFLFFFCFNTSWLCGKVSSVEERRLFFLEMFCIEYHTFLLWWIRDVALAYLTFSRQRQRTTTSTGLCVEMMMTTVMHISSSLSLKMAWDVVRFICVLPHSLSQRDCRFIFGLSCLMEKKNQVFFIVARAQLQSVELSPNANVHYTHDEPNEPEKKKTAHTASFGWRWWWWW